MQKAFLSENLSKFAITGCKISFSNINSISKHSLYGYNAYKGIVAHIELFCD